MPAIITHDFFAQEVYKEMHQVIGGTRDEYEAFLLGSQGPDPLFYSVLVPHLRGFTSLGSTMHSEKPNELLVAMKESLSILSPEDVSVGRAYLFGFLCHYTLDSAMHPLVYFNEYSICDAGVENLNRKNGSEVHAIIESEFDEMVLFKTRHQTIATFSPAKEILKASDQVLSIISKMYVYAALIAYGLYIPATMFASCVKSFRRTQRLFYSPSGTKRAVLGKVEEVFRPYSFYRSMSARPRETTESEFDNHEHNLWKNPFTGAISNEGFWDIYSRSTNTAAHNIDIIDKPEFNLGRAEEITHNIDFLGEPTVAILTIEDDIGRHA